MRAIGKVIHLGGNIATAKGSVVDGAGKLYARSTTTCLLSEVSHPSRVPIAHAEFVAAFKAWSDAGGPCPGD